MLACCRLPKLFAADKLLCDFSALKKGMQCPEPAFPEGGLGADEAGLESNEGCPESTKGREQPFKYFRKMEREQGKKMTWCYQHFPHLCQREMQADGYVNPKPAASINAVREQTQGPVSCKQGVCCPGEGGHYRTGYLLVSVELGGQLVSWPHVILTSKIQITERVWEGEQKSKQ